MCTSIITGCTKRNENICTSTGECKCNQICVIQPIMQSGLCQDIPKIYENATIILRNRYTMEDINFTNKCK